jgi:hypothetical protein
MKISIITSTFAVSCCALAAFTPQVALAQDSTALATEYVGLTSGGSSQNADHIGGAGYETFVPTAQISSSDNQISADVSLDYRLAGKPKLDREGTKLTGSFLTLSLKGSIPLNGSDPDSLIDFRNFGNSGKLTIGFNYFRPSVVSAASSYPVIVRSGRACVEDAIQNWEKEGIEQEAAVAAGTAAIGRYDAAQRGDGNLGVFELVDAAVGQAPVEGSVEAAIKAQCTRSGNSVIGNDSRLAMLFAHKALSPAEFAAWRRQHRKVGKTIFFGGEVSLGYNRFSIVDRPALRLNRTDRVGIDANGRIGVIFNRANSLVTANFGYVRSYEAKEVVDVCGPPDISGKTTCINGQDGNPDRKETGYAGLAVRQVLLRNKNGEPIVGIRPSATYVFEDKDWQFELPIYFQRSSEGKLDAGVRAIYNTGKDKIAFGAFVGVPF